MKQIILFVFIVSVFSVPLLAGSAKNQFKVKVSGGTTSALAGHHMEITIDSDSIKAIDKTACAVAVNSSNGDCPVGSPDVISAQFSPSAVIEVVAGQAAHFVGVSWNSNGQRDTLTFETDKKEYPLIVALLEEVAGKKAINADTQTSDRPRVFLRSESYGNRVSALRDQSMEMASDFKKICPTVLITINEQKADFTLQLNHIEAGFSRDNQVEIYNKDGDLISGKEGGSIANQVKAACALITTEWAASRQ